ncbi:MAG: MFS transporter [Gemmatimonadaceae bacterium]|nr:MFS transporter [Gemmatimonadaceae bacterium]
MRFGVLYFPFGLMVGVPSVALGWMATRAGLPVSATATIVGTAFLPHSWKFLWAPVGDVTLSRKRWYLLAVSVVAASLFGLCTVPLTAATLPLVTAIVFTGNVAGTFVAFAVEGLMAHNTGAHGRGRAAGWFQTGNMVGQTAGGGLALFLLNRAPAPWMAGTALATLVACCALALLRVEEAPPVVGARLGDRLREAGREIRRVLSGIDGRLALLLAFLPIGTGASQFLFSAIAPQWAMTAERTAVVLGLAAGAAIAIGTVTGGWLSDRLTRRSAYALVCAVQVLAVLALWLSPRTPWAFTVVTLGYTASLGACTGALTGMVLDLVGEGATATKMNLFIALNTMGGLAMIKFAGMAHDRGGVDGLFLAEAAVAGACILLFLLVARQVRRA